MKAIIENLLNHKNFLINIHQQLKINDISLKNVFSETKINIKPNHHIVCSHLMELGYLSYVYDPEHRNQTLARIPNQEIWQYFFNEFKEYYIFNEKVEESIF